MKFLSLMLLASAAFASTLFAHGADQRSPTASQVRIDPYVKAQRDAVRNLVEARKRMARSQDQLGKLQHRRHDRLADQRALHAQRDQLENSIARQKLLISDLEHRQHELLDEIRHLESDRHRRGHGDKDLRRIVSIFGQLALGEKPRVGRRDRRQLRSLRHELEDLNCQLLAAQTRYDRLCAKIVHLRRDCAQLDRELVGLDRRIGRAERRFQGARVDLSRALARVRQTARALGQRAQRNRGQAKVKSARTRRGQRRHAAAYRRR